MEEGGEMTRHSKTELDHADPHFSDALVPMYAFYMQTKHKKGERREALARRLLKSTEGLPKEIQDRAKAYIETQVASYKDVDDKERIEAHIVVVAKDIKTGDVKGFVNNGAEREGMFTGASDVREIGTCDDYEFARVQTAPTLAQMQFTPDWRGERQTPIEIEAQSFTEFMQKIESAGIKDHFMALYPHTTMPKGSVKSIHTVMTKTRRAQLVKRFGAKNIKALEAKIKHNES